MTSGEPANLTPANARYPARLRERLGANAPEPLSALGNLDLLALPKTALSCSARRNELVAALADEMWFAHINPGGKMEVFAKRRSI